MDRAIRLLIVEDSEDDALLIIREIRKAGFDVDYKRVSSKEAFQRALNDEKWDIVISDYSLPGFNGRAALEVFNAWGGDIPFIMVSGTIGEETAVEAMRAGAHDYVMKDSLTRLGPAVDRELKEAEMRRLKRVAERHLQREKEFSELIIDSIPGIFFVLDEKCRIQRWNRNLQGWYADLDLRNREVIGLIAATDRDSYRKELHAALKGVPVSREVRLECADGRVRPFLIQGRLLQQGELRRLVCIGVETTELKRAQEEKERLRLELQQAQKMEAIGRLAGGLAHDFNNLLSVILSSLEMAWLDLKDGRSVAEELQQIQEAATRAEDLTRQLLAFSRKQSLEMKRVDLNELIRGMRKLLRRLLREDIELELELADGLPPIYADAGQIEQIIMNLAVNAQDALSGGGKIRLATRIPESPPGPGMEPDKYVQIDFIDTGIGMDAETRERIFEPFFTTKEFGTGLGLSTVYGIVAQHGGKIDVDSEPGQGTKFSIYLPQAEAFGKKEAEAAIPELGSLYGSERILLVEDDPAVRKVVEKILLEYGYRVHAAEDAVSALEYAEKFGNEIDLLLTDIIMPGLNGRELYDRISKFCPRARVIFMSGYTDEMLDREDLRSAEFHFLQKPVTMDRLGRMVRAVLDGKQPPSE